MSIQLYLAGIMVILLGFNKILFLFRSTQVIKMLYPEERGVEIDPEVLWEQVLGVMKASYMIFTSVPPLEVIYHLHIAFFF